MLLGLFLPIFSVNLVMEPFDAGKFRTKPPHQIVSHATDKEQACVYAETLLERQETGHEFDRLNTHNYQDFNLYEVKNEYLATDGTQGMLIYNEHKTTGERYVTFVLGTLPALSERLNEILLGFRRSYLQAYQKAPLSPSASEPGTHPAPTPPPAQNTPEVVGQNEKNDSGGMWSPFGEKSRREGLQPKPAQAVPSVAPTGSSDPHSAFRPIPRNRHLATAQKLIDDVSFKIASDSNKIGLISQLTGMRAKVQQEIDAPQASIPSPSPSLEEKTLEAEEQKIKELKENAETYLRNPRRGLVSSDDDSLAGFDRNVTKDELKRAVEAIGIPKTEYNRVEPSGYSFFHVPTLVSSLEKRLAEIKQKFESPERLAQKRQERERIQRERAEAEQRREVEIVDLKEAFNALNEAIKTLRQTHDRGFVDNVRNYTVQGRQSNPA